jgi:ketosteroid isomerase-like protein
VKNLPAYRIMFPSGDQTGLQHLVRPTTVLPSHVGEQATSGGVVRGNTRTEWFARNARPFAEVVLPVSDVTLAFDGEGALYRVSSLGHCTHGRQLRRARR